MTTAAEITRRLDPRWLRVLPQRIGGEELAAAREEIAVLLATHYEQGIYPLPRGRDVMVTAIWALDDFTPGNGATRVIPGSHRRATARQETSETMPAEMPAGSMLLFTGRLWHGAGANTSTTPRLGVVIDYAQPWLRPCEAHTLSADPGQVRQLPQRLQELLGFNQPSP